MDLSKYRALWEDMDSSLISCRDEANELRQAAGEISADDDPKTMHEQLIQARRAMDRLEEILANVGLVRSRVRKLVGELQAVYDDKFAQNVVNDRTGEYSSAKAQDARYQAGALTELINLRKAKKLLADVEETYEFVNLKYRGLDSARRDMDSRIRILNLTSQLER